VVPVGSDLGTRLTDMPTLTADRIISAAIEVLDEEGLGGLNMRELGRRLDCASTTVYWHIKTKDELLRLAADALWAEISLPDLDSRHWRPAATAMAAGTHAMLGRHPWLVQAFGSHLLYGPGKARHDDHLLALYEKAGFAGAAADCAAAAVFTYVLGSALPHAAQVSLTRQLGRNGKDATRALAQAMQQATEIATAFPHLRERIDRPTAYCDAPNSSFEFGLRAVLDGLQARLDAAGLSRPGSLRRQDPQVPAVLTPVPLECGTPRVAGYRQPSQCLANSGGRPAGPVSARSDGPGSAEQPAQLDGEGDRCLDLHFADRDALHVETERHTQPTAESHQLTGIRQALLV